MNAFLRTVRQVHGQRQIQAYSACSAEQGPPEKEAQRPENVRQERDIFFLACEGLFMASCDIQRFSWSSTTFFNWPISQAIASGFRKPYLKSGNSNKTTYACLHCNAFYGKTSVKKLLNVE